MSKEAAKDFQKGWSEAGKDSCFESAARRRIAADPRAWLALAPGKLRATFDYCGAGGWYLHQANPAAFGARAKLVLGAAETVFERLAFRCGFGRRREQGVAEPQWTLVPGARLVRPAPLEQRRHRAKLVLADEPPIEVE